MKSRGDSPAVITYIHLTMAVSHVSRQLRVPDAVASVTFALGGCLLRSCHSVFDGSVTATLFQILGFDCHGHVEVSETNRVCQRDERWSGALAKSTKIKRSKNTLILNCANLCFYSLVNSGSHV